jgi:hypothetical protein
MAAVPNPALENQVLICIEDMGVYNHVLLVWYKHTSINGQNATVVLEFGPRSNQGENRFIAWGNHRSYVNIEEFKGFVPLHNIPNRRLQSIGQARCHQNFAFFANQRELQNWAQDQQQDTYHLMVNDCRHFAKRLYHHMTGRDFDVNATQGILGRLFGNLFDHFGPFSI